MPLPFLPALVMPAIIKRIFSPLASLWRWLTADWHRMAFAVLIGLCAFLCWRLASVDGNRDDWRTLARKYEAASKEVKAADVKADATGLATAATTKGQIDDANERAKAAAAGSDDPLAAGLRSLRTEGAGGRDKAAN